MIVNRFEESIYYKIFSIIFSISVLLWMGIYNHYPLIYPDTGAYISSGHSGIVPIDRPITYGLFIRHISLSWSLWLVAIVQCLIIIYLIYAYLVFVQQQKYSFILIPVIVIVLSFTTGLSYYTSQIMPDIFTGVYILAFIVLLFASHIPKKHIWVLSAIFIISIVVHLSNILISCFGEIIIFLILFIFRNKFGKSKKYFGRIKKIVLLTIIAWLIIPGIHFMYGGSFSFSKSSHVFLMGRMVESGALLSFLKDNCETHNYDLCNSVDKLPKDANVFLWDMNSPLYNGKCKAINWESCWLDKKEEYDSINHLILFNGKYRNIYLANSLANSVAQLLSFKCDLLPAEIDNSSASEMIKWHYESEYNSYLNSKQSQSQLKFSVINSIQEVTLILSLAGIIILFLFFNTDNEKNSKEPLMFLTITIYLLINALSCAFLSSITNRYQGRIIWLIPLLFIFILVKYISSKKQKRRLTVK